MQHEGTSTEDTCMELWNLDFSLGLFKFTILVSYKHGSNKFHKCNDVRDIFLKYVRVTRGESYRLNPELKKS